MKTLTHKIMPNIVTTLMIIEILMSSLLIVLSDFVSFIAFLFFYKTLAKESRSDFFGLGSTFLFHIFSVNTSTMSTWHVSMT